MCVDRWASSPFEVPGNLTVYHHDPIYANGSRYAGTGGPRGTRDAGCYLTHVYRRYNTLADRTLFLHDDMHIHNPVWRRWLGCLRSNASFASFSPIRRKRAVAITSHSTVRSILALLGVDPESRTRIQASCCMLFMQSQESIRSVARRSYATLLEQLHVGKMSPFRIEDSMHMLSSANVTWLDPCVNFECQRPECRRIVRYIPIGGEALTHGVPFQSHSQLNNWKSGACGVVSHGNPGVLNGFGNYVRFESGCIGKATFLNHPKSAQWASYALKPALRAALTPCWQTCCFRCANSLRCAQWAWNMSHTNHSKGVCLLWSHVSKTKVVSNHHVLGLFP